MLRDSELELCRALRLAFPGRLEFEEVLATVDKNLDGIIGTAMGLDIGVRRVVRVARTEGWLAQLEAASFELNPGNPALQEWRRRHRAHGGAAHQPAPGAAGPPWQQFDPKYFDLKLIRAAILTAVTQAPEPVLGFGVRYMDFKFIEKLQHIVKDHLPGETQDKSPLNLKPEYERLSPKLERVRGYGADLDTGNVLCVVYVDSTPPGHFANFWQQVRQEFAGSTHHFALLFVGDDETAFPSTVTELPPPLFDKDDLTLWAGNTVMLISWPAVLAVAWAELLCAGADTGTGLDVGRVYEAMESSIKEIRFDAEGFRRKLENRMSR